MSRQNIDGDQRLACASAECRFVHWNNPTPVVAALVRLGGSYVLARNGHWPSGIFSLLTGFLEEGESPESAVVREVGEELGLAVRDVQFIGHFSFRERNQLIIAFVCEGQGALELSGEIAETRRIPHHELAHYDFGPLRLTQEIVARWLDVSNEKQVDT